MENDVGYTSLEVPQAGDILSLRCTSGLWEGTSCALRHAPWLPCWEMRALPLPTTMEEWGVAHGKVHCRGTGTSVPITLDLPSAKSPRNRRMAFASPRVPKKNNKEESSLRRTQLRLCAPVPDLISPRLTFFFCRNVQ